MKKNLLLILFIVTLILVIAAAYFAFRIRPEGQPMVTDGPQSAAETPAPTLAPTDAPLRMTLVGEGVTEEFLAAFSEAIGPEPVLTVLEGDASALSALMADDAVVLWLEGADADLSAVAEAAAGGLPVIVYNRGGADLPMGAVDISVAAENAASDALEAAITYPPHDTPVRLLGLFETEGEARTLFANAVEAGRVLNKGTHAESDGASLEDWLTDRLSELYPGMLDAVYVETPALAVRVTETMAALGRDDFEVFAAGGSAALSALAARYPRVLPVLTGVDDAAAGRACGEAALIAAGGGQPESVVLTPGPKNEPAETPEPDDAALPTGEIAAETEGSPVPEETSAPAA